MAGVEGEAKQLRFYVGVYFNFILMHLFFVFNVFLWLLVEFGHLFIICDYLISKL